MAQAAQAVGASSRAADARGLSESEEGSPADCMEDSTWSIPSQSEPVPGYFAWDLLSIGRRFEMWIAWCSDRLTPVCLKIPRKDRLDERTIAAMRREWEAASAMAHPAIPRVFEANFDGPVPFIVTEHIEGNPLSRVIAEDGPLDNQELVFVALQLAAALRHVHGRGFVHLDVKPSNVMLRGDRLLLLDFDISLPTGGQRSTTKARGTRFYIPPEQIRCEPAAPTMDLFALGALLYEAACGHRAFDVETEDVTTETTPGRRVYRQLGEPIPSASEAAPSLEPAIAAVIDKLLSRKVEDRPASAEEVVRLCEVAASQSPKPLETMWPGWVSDAILRR